MARLALFLVLGLAAVATVAAAAHDGAASTAVRRRALLNSKAFCSSKVASKGGACTQLLAAGQYNYFLAIVNATGLTSTLCSNTFNGTAFVPTDAAMATLGPVICSKLPITIPNCSLAVVLALLAQNPTIAAVVGPRLANLTLYHASPKYAPEGTLRSQTKGGKTVQLPTYFVPNNAPVSYINVTRPSSGYYVTGENDNPLFNLPSDTGLILQFAIASTCNAATSSKSTWNAIDIVLIP